MSEPLEMLRAALRTLPEDKTIEILRECLTPGERARMHAERICDAAERRRASFSGYLRVINGPEPQGLQWEDEPAPDPDLPEPAYRTNFGAGLVAWSADQMRTHRAVGVSVERCRILDALMRKHEEAKGAHNYYLCLANELFPEVPR